MTQDSFVLEIVDDKNDNACATSTNVETTTEQNNKFTCSLCNKVYATENKLKKHVNNIHTLTKRKRGMDETSTISQAKKPSLDTVNESPEAMNDTVLFCKEFLGYPGDNTLSEESFLSSRDVAAFNSTAIDDAFKPDQDHDFILKDESVMLHAKVMSLEADLKHKNNIIDEHEKELELAKIEISELTERLSDTEATNRELKVSFETALVRANSSEAKIEELSKNLKLYSFTIKKFKAAKSGTNTDNVPDNIKNKKLTDAEARCRQLAQRLSELESPNPSNDLEQQVKEAKDNLHTKVKELRPKESSLRKAEKTACELNDKLVSAQNKITELENTITRLRLNTVQDPQSNEVRKIDNKVTSPGTSKNNKTPSTSDTHAPNARKKTSSPRRSPVKCKLDNSGKCPRGRDCRDKHSSKTCQHHSKYGSCPFESQCEHRHPKSVCFEWQSQGACRYGEDCRHKHPNELRATDQQQHFLGAQPQDQPSNNQWIPYRHHDLRGSRW